MTKHAQKTERREQILQAALACFARKGYRLTTMDDIVAESGLSKGSLYWHFKNKKDLLLSIISWYFAQMEQDLEKMVRAAPTASEKLTMLAEVIAQLFSAPELEPVVNVFIDFYAETRHDTEVEAVVRQVLNPYIEFVTNIIEAGIAAAEFKAVDAQQMTIALLAAFDGMVLYRMLVSPEFDWIATTRLFTNTFLNGLKAVES